MKGILFLALLVSLGHCQDPDCPDPVDCVSNPCETEICPRFLNARCAVDNCNGECRALFFHRNSDRLLTAENCTVPTCATRDPPCSERRTCVDEAFPPNCPPDEPRCRQFMRPICVLFRRPPPPSDCSVVQCGPGMVCEIIETRRGSEAKCVEFRPTTCEELGPCDPGMVCRIRPRDGKHPIVRCVPERITTIKPSDCSQVQCMAGFRCELFGRPDRKQRARCVRDRPPPPQTCEELNCEEAGMICTQRGGRNICRSPENCDEAVCPGDRVCSILNIARDIPQEFRCPFNERVCKLEVVTKLDGGRILGCRDPALSLEPCDEVECPDNKVCAGKFLPQGDRMISTCVPKDLIAAVPTLANCETVPNDFCSESENEACIDLEQNGYRAFAHCSQINCDDVTPCTTEEDTCIQSSSRLLGETGISSSCAPVDRIMVEQDTTCAGGRSPCPQNTTCSHARMNNALVGTICIPPFRLPPRQCDELSCEDGEECVMDVIAGQVVRASCVESMFIRELLSAMREVLESE